MKRLVNTLSSSSTRTAKTVARKILRTIPPPKSRLTGTLAIDGGTPVRNSRFRPWPEFPTASLREWAFSVAPVFRQTFCSGVEGLPQPLAKQFAREWAQYCGVKHALLLPHGTDALRIGIAAALNHDGLDHGGEIIVPNLSFIASATAALDRRLGVALVDVDAKTLNVDPSRVEEAIVPGKTKAIMAVHLFGQPADMASLRALAKKHALVLIEDAAQAHGAIHELGKAGSLGDVAAFSFQGFKNLPSGEGGALTTNDSALFEKAYGIHNVGRRLVGGLRWAHETLGWNCRSTEYVATVLLHRLKKLEFQQQTRWSCFQLLHDRLADLASVKPLDIGPGVVRHGVHMFALRFRGQACGGLDIQDFLNALQAEGVPIYRGYEKTLAQQPVIRNLLATRPDYARSQETPVADKAVQDLIYLPHQIFLTSEEEMIELAAAFRKVEAHYAKQARTSLVGIGIPASPPIANKTNVEVAQTEVQTLKVGIVGAGFMGLQHAQALSKAAHFALTGISDVNPESVRQAAQQYKCAAYDSAERLLAEGGLDVAIVATPHWQHADLAGFALRKGLHVICEKPLTVTVEQADHLLSLAASSQKLFAAVHQTRLEPSYQYAKKLLESGEMGAVCRCSMVESAWRTDAYYKSSPWRGTWKGEGGGVLLNQAPHVLDRYAWLCGMPASVIGKCDTNLHTIEVEDTVSAILKHRSGLHGFLHINTVECPPVSETVICCDQGRIILDRGRVRVTRLKSSIRDATRREKRPWGHLQSETHELEFPYGDVMDSLLVQFYNNFADAVAGRGDLVCPGREGRDTVELANAIVLSSAEKRELQLPLDRSAYSSFIKAKLRQ